MATLLLPSWCMAHAFKRALHDSKKGFDLDRLTTLTLEVYKRFVL